MAWQCLSSNFLVSTQALTLFQIPIPKILCFITTRHIDAAVTVKWLAGIFYSQAASNKNLTFLSAHHNFPFQGGFSLSAFSFSLLQLILSSFGWVWIITTPYTHIFAFLNVSDVCMYVLFLANDNSCLRTRHDVSVVSWSIKVPYQSLFLKIKVGKMKIKLQKKKSSCFAEKVYIVESMLMSSSGEFIASYHMHQITAED